MSFPSPAPRRSVYQRALDHGFRGLRFEPALEREYEAFTSRANLARVRWAAWLVLLLFSLFVGVDITTLPPHVWHATASIRLFVVMPFFAMVLVASHLDRWRAHLQGPIMTAALFAGVGTVAVIGAALRLGYPIPYEGILLVSLFIYLIACLSWWRAVAVNGVTLLAFVAMELAWQRDPQARLYQMLFMGAANAVGAYGGYFLEHGARTAFIAQCVLNDLAQHDALTGLHNRRALDEHLARIWRQAARSGGGLAIAMIDVDHFKRYNDRYGHIEGDAVLQAVAAAVATQARRPLDLAARYGGEEFLVVWYEPLAADVAAMAEQLRAAVESLALPHAGSDSRVVTASVGVAHAPRAGATTPDALLQVADTALYAAKQAGRNRACISLLPPDGSNPNG